MINVLFIKVFFDFFQEQVVLKVKCCWDGKNNFDCKNDGLEFVELGYLLIYWYFMQEEGKCVFGCFWMENCLADMLWQWLEKGYYIEFKLGGMF